MIDLVPDLVEPNKLDEDLLGLLDSIEVSLGIILDLMDLLGDGFLNLGSFVLFLADLILLFDLVLDLLQVIIDIFGVVQFL